MLIALLVILFASNSLVLAMDAPAPSSTEISIPKEELLNFIVQASRWNRDKLSYYEYCMKWGIECNQEPVFNFALKKWAEEAGNRADNNPFMRERLPCTLVTATKYNRIWAIEKICDCSRNVIIDSACTQKTCNNFTPLIMAAYMGHSQAVTFLLFKGATPEIIGGDDSTALIEAIKHDKLACTHALLAKASPNSVMPDNSFGSVLHWALSLGNRNEHVRALLNKGARKNLIRKQIEYEQEGTPLMVAVAHLNLDGVRILLEEKVNLKLKKTFNRGLLKQQVGCTATEHAQLAFEIECVPQRKEIRRQIFEMLTHAEKAGAE